MGPFSCGVSPVSQRMWRGFADFYVLSDYIVGWDRLNPVSVCNWYVSCQDAHGYECLKVSHLVPLSCWVSLGQGTGRSGPCLWQDSVDCTTGTNHAQWGPALASASLHAASSERSCPLSDAAS